MVGASQRGFIRLGKLIPLLCLGGLVYGGVTFWPVADSYYRVWRAAQLLAKESAAFDSQPEAAVQQFTNSVYRDTGITLVRSSVDLDRSDPLHTKVSIGLMLPYRYPFTREQRFVQATIRASAKRSGE